ncbi:MAG TPA: hypothetical protein VMT38_10730 [Terracidiphilus sp.]|nr:hypothetical protein [Terracidiphilus sp.]
MKPKTNSEKTFGAIDEILAIEDELIPSSGFLAATMERVREEAVTPKPIPFPWLRALPGIVLVAVVLGWCGFELVRAISTVARGNSAATLQAFSPALVHWPVANAHLQDVGWVAMALGIALFSWLLSRRLAGGSGLL